MNGYSNEEHVQLFQTADGSPVVMTPDGIFTMEELGFDLKPYLMGTLFEAKTPTLSRVNIRLSNEWDDWSGGGQSIPNVSMNMDPYIMIGSELSDVPINLTLVESEPE